MLILTDMNQFPASCIHFVGISVMNFPPTSGNTTSREVFVMFVNLGISFRMMVSDDVLNVMPIIGNESLKGVVKLLIITKLF
jgi:hypothetical protein